MLLSISLVGCASISSVTAPNRGHLGQLSLGMDKQKVLKLMGTRVMKVKSDLFHAVIINNPYRSETLDDKDGKNYEVLYYVTDNKNDDFLVGDSDLTPLVIDNDGKLVGWGQNFLTEFITRNQVKNLNQTAKPDSGGGLGFGKKKKK